MKRPLQNAASLLLSDGLARLIGFAVNIYLARVLEPEGFGIITVGMSVLGYLLLAASPGIQTVETRNVAAAAAMDHARIGAVLSFRLMLALVLWCAAVVTAMLAVENPWVRGSIIRYAAAVVPLSLMLDWAFAGKEDFKAVGISKVLNACVFALAAFLFVRSGADVLLTPVAFAAGAAASALMLALVYRSRFGAFSLQWSAASWKRIAAENLPVGVGVFLGQNVTGLPPIIVAAFAGTAAAGQLGAALKPIFALLALDRLINALLLPAMARYASSAPQELPRLFGVAVRTVLFIGIALSAVAIIAAPWLISILFGEGYGDAIVLFRILVPYVAITLVSSVFVVTLVSAGRERAYTRIMLVATTVLTVVVLVLTWRFGAAGAAWGVLGGEALAAVLLGREAQTVTGFRWSSVLSSPAGDIRFLRERFL